MKECYVIVYHNAGGEGLNTNYQSLELPCYPEELGEQTSANWNDQAIVGRSSPISSYAGTGYRAVSFNFPLHREMNNSANSSAKIEEILQLLRKSIYPKYVSPGLLPPTVKFVFGDFVASGYVNSVNFTWKKPIINNLYTVCEVQISMNCVPFNVFGANELGTSSNPFKDKKSLISTSEYERAKAESVAIKYVQSGEALNTYSPFADLFKGIHGFINR